MWLRIIELILSLLDRLYDTLEEAKRQGEAKNAQKERDKIEADPADYLIEHFSGVRSQETSKTSDSDKASNRNN